MAPKASSPDGTEKKQKVPQMRSSDVRMKSSNMLQKYKDRESSIPSQQDSSDRFASETPSAEIVEFDKAEPRRCMESRCNSRGPLDPYHFLSLQAKTDSLTVACIECRLLKGLDKKRSDVWTDKKGNSKELRTSLTEYGKKIVSKYGNLLAIKRPTKLLPPLGDIKLEENRLRQVIPKLVQVVMREDENNNLHHERNPDVNSEDCPQIVKRTPHKSDLYHSDSTRAQTRINKRRIISTTSEESYVPESDEESTGLIEMLHQLADLPYAKRKKVSKRVGLVSVRDKLEGELSKAQKRNKLYERLAYANRQIKHEENQKADIERELAALPPESECSDDE